MANTAEEVWKLLGELLEVKKETERRFQDLEQKIKEIENKVSCQYDNKSISINQEQEDDKEFDLLFKQLSQQISDLPGGYTDGFALESMGEFLYDKFAVRVISASTCVTKKEEYLEIDVLAYNNNEVYIVEVKSHAKEESIEQLKTILERFRHFFPEHQNKHIYGILAAVDLSSEVRQKALQEGLYVALIQGDMFTLDTPADFQPQVW